MPSVRDLRPDLQDYASALIDALGAAGYLPQLTSTVRTYGQQARLYRRYLAGLSSFPAAPPGKSSHEFSPGLAFDLVTTPMDVLADAGRIWESWGHTWGGRFGDAIHFEHGNTQGIIADLTSGLTGLAGRAITAYERFQEEHPIISALAIPLPLTETDEPASFSWLDRLLQ